MSFSTFGNAVQVGVRMEMVTNPGTGLERVNDVTRANHAELRSELNDLRDAFRR